MKYTGSFLLISQIVLFQILVISSPSAEANILKNIKGFLKDLFGEGDNGEGENKANMPKKMTRDKKLAWKSCLRKRTNLEDLNSATELCDEEFDDQNWEDKKKDILHSSACFRACQLDHLGWHKSDLIVVKRKNVQVYEAGDTIEFNSTAVEQFVLHTFPETVHSALQESINECGAKVDTARLSDEKQCKSYKPLLNCIDKAVNKNCRKSRKDKKKMVTMMTSTTAESTSVFEESESEASSVTSEPEVQPEAEAEATESTEPEEDAAADKEE